MFSGPVFNADYDSVWKSELSWKFILFKAILQILFTKSVMALTPFEGGYAGHIIFAQFLFNKYIIVVNVINAQKTVGHELAALWSET